MFKTIFNNITQRLAKHFATDEIRTAGPHKDSLKLFIAKDVQLAVQNNPLTWTCLHVDIVHGPKSLKWYRQEIYEYLLHSEHVEVLNTNRWDTVPFTLISGQTGRKPSEERAKFVDYLVEKYK